MLPCCTVTVERPGAEELQALWRAVGWGETPLPRLAASIAAYTATICARDGEARLVGYASVFLGPPDDDDDRRVRRRSGPAAPGRRQGHDAVHRGGVPGRADHDPRDGRLAGLLRGTRFPRAVGAGGLPVQEAGRGGRLNRCCRAVGGTTRRVRPATPA
ncbi:MAG: hypothetical protein MZW92_73610 [Comamonadaceae bacterium]|nr:hypothetical protein [Comamonadaceae bacterium]